jgi:hypothetical protein
VKDRANAVVQWLMAAEQQPQLIQGAWLLLLESDYVWMSPLEVRGWLPLEHCAMVTRAAKGEHSP